MPSYWSFDQILAPLVWSILASIIQSFLNIHSFCNISNCSVADIEQHWRGADLFFYFSSFFFFLPPLLPHPSTSPLMHWGGGWSPPAPPLVLIYIVKNTHLKKLKWLMIWEEGVLYYHSLYRLHIWHHIIIRCIIYEELCIVPPDSIVISFYKVIINHLSVRRI